MEGNLHGRIPHSSCEEEDAVKYFKYAGDKGYLSIVAIGKDSSVVYSKKTWRYRHTLIGFPSNTWAEITEEEAKKCIVILSITR